jgi:hypothetical protein
MIDQKVVIMQLGYQFNSNNIMHIQESQLRIKENKINSMIVVRCTEACLGLLAVSTLDWC